MGTQHLLSLRTYMVKQSIKMTATVHSRSFFSKCLPCMSHPISPFSSTPVSVNIYISGLFSAIKNGFICLWAKGHEDSVYLPIRVVRRERGDHAQRNVFVEAEEQGGILDLIILVISGRKTGKRQGHVMFVQKQRNKTVLSSSPFTLDDHWSIKYEKVEENGSCCQLVMSVWKEKPSPA